MLRFFHMDVRVLVKPLARWARRYILVLLVTALCYVPGFRTETLLYAGLMHIYLVPAQLYY